MPFRLRTIRKSAAPLVWLLSAMLFVLPLRQHDLAGVAEHVAEWVVMCFGTDGHVGVEGAHTHDGDVAATSPEGFLLDVAHQAPCLDVPLLGGHLDGESRPSDPATSDVGSSAVVIAILPLPMVAVPAVAPCHPASCARPAEPLTSLRTVVLLT